MKKRTNYTKSSEQGLQRQGIQKYWLAASVLLLSILVLVMGAPAWAAPPNQTVPIPTPTPEDSPFPTATPRPEEDDEDESDSEDDSDENADDDFNDGFATDPSSDDGLTDAPLDALPGTDTAAGVGETVEDPAGATEGIAGIVNVAALNIRAEPSEEAEIIGAAYLSESLAATQLSDNGDWLFACCASGTETSGWVKAEFLDGDFAALAGQPAMAAAAVPQTTGETVETSLWLIIEQLPPYVLQGQTFDLQFTVVNPGEIDAKDVVLSDELPSALKFVDAQVEGGGEIQRESSEDGSSIFVVNWSQLPAGETATATVTLQMDIDTSDGSVIDNLAVARAGNAPDVTAGIGIGMPPLLLPEF